MDRARGIDVIAVLLIVVLIVETVGALIGQRGVWIQGELLARLFRSPLVPSVMATTAIVFGLEGLVRRRDEKAMFTRVVAMLIIAIAMPVAAVVGVATRMISPKMPVG
ncbi:MAG: hypothetical protein JNM17_06615 [Archangium sp.]|nr:hypothetical protein [Archangium sp.]